MNNSNNTLMYDGPRYRPEGILSRQSPDIIELLKTDEGTLKNRLLSDLHIKLGSELGRGAQAIVYHGDFCEPETGVIAVKRIMDNSDLHPVDEEYISALVHQHGIMGELANAGAYVTNSYGVFSIDLGSPRPEIILLNELVGNGVTLSNLLGNDPSLQVNNRIPLHPTIAKEYIRSLLETTILCEDKGIIHGDIKPDNLIETAEGKIKLADFGIAYRVGSEFAPKEGVRKGTPNYMSYENFQGRNPIDTDRHAIACIAYEVLTGRKPFSGNSLAQIGYKKGIFQFGESNNNQVKPTQYEGWNNWLSVALKSYDNYSSAEQMLDEFDKMIKDEKDRPKNEPQIWPVTFARPRNLPETVMLSRIELRNRQLPKTQVMNRSKIE